MLSRVSRISAVSLGHRFYSAAAVNYAIPLTDAASAITGAAAAPLPTETKVGTLENGISIGVVENHSPVSQLSIAVKAGSRYEAHNQQGLAHLLRRFGFQRTKTQTAFRINRELENLGGIYNTTHDRELVVYSSVFRRDDLEHFSDVLVDVLTNTRFLDYELADLTPYINEDRELFHANGVNFVNEALHRVAFRDGLGNRLYCPSDRLGSYTGNDIQKYLASRLNTSNVFVAGVGVGFNDLQQVLQSRLSSVPTGGNKSVDTPKYFGGNLHFDSSNPIGHIGIGYSVPVGLNDKGNLAYSVLQMALHGNSMVPYASAASLLSNLPAETQGTSALFSYGNAGLFALVLQGPQEKVAEAANVAQQQLQKLASGISAEHLSRAKRLTLMKISESVDSRANSSQYILHQLAAGGFKSAEEAAASLESVTEGSIKDAAATLLKSKPSVVSYGDQVWF